jgi:predicted transcriptional regulator
MLSHNEEKIVRILSEGMATPKQLAEKLGKGYTELKAQSMVLTLARKGLVDKTKAALILRGTEMLKFLSMPVGGGLKGGIPAPKLK